MRDIVTTVLEVVGLLAIAAGIASEAWVRVSPGAGLAAFGALLIVMSLVIGLRS